MPINFRISMVVVVAAMILSPRLAQASSNDACAKMPYNRGILKKYEYKGDTIAAGMHKSFLLMSTTEDSTESTTSSVDPGVTTGRLLSSAQFTSSWGDCSAIDTMYAKSMRNDYIEQNLQEIKKQIAMGHGYHIGTLALLSGCRNSDQSGWAEQLQSFTSEFYDLKTGQSFGEVMDQMIQANPGLHATCAPSA